MNYYRKNAYLLSLLLLVTALEKKLAVGSTRLDFIGCINFLKLKCSVLLKVSMKTSKNSNLMSFYWKWLKYRKKFLKNYNCPTRYLTWPLKSLELQHIESLTSKHGSPPKRTTEKYAVLPIAPTIRAAD